MKDDKENRLRGASPPLRPAIQAPAPSKTTMLRTLLN